jgi:hypothetical protein
VDHRRRHRMPARRRLRHRVTFRLFAWFVARLYPLLRDDGRDSR